MVARWPVLAAALGVAFYLVLRSAGPVLDALPPLPDPLPGSQRSGRVEAQPAPEEPADDESAGGENLGPGGSGEATGGLAVDDAVPPAGDNDSGTPGGTPTPGPGPNPGPGPGPGPVPPPAPPPPTPVVATAVVLHRDGPHGREVLLVRRGAERRFAGGFHAFPGGRLDPEDPLVPVKGADGEEAALVACATRELFASAQALLGRVRGGLGIATVLANALFAAITGVSVASAAVFSKIAIPEMERLNYDRRFSLGIVASSAILGMLIPPSVLMIVYGVLTEQAIGRLFIAGVLPGLVVVAVLSLGIWTMVLVKPRLGGRQVEARRLDWRTLLRAATAPSRAQPDRQTSPSA